MNCVSNTDLYRNESGSSSISSSSSKLSINITDETSYEELRAIDVDNGLNEGIPDLNDVEPVMPIWATKPIFEYFDKRYNISKLRYPYCAEATIQAISDIALMIEINKEERTELQLRMINEFIFDKIEKLNEYGIPRVHSEYQLMNILIEYICKSQSTPAIRNAIILNVFPREQPRIVYLGNLICFAICLSHSEVLEAAGIWLQQADLKTNICEELALHIVKYFSVDAPSLVTCLIDVAKLAPYFNSNLLTVIVEMVKGSDPSDHILYLVDAWINTNPKILTAPLTYHSILPIGEILKNPVTPIGGLSRWCIMSPARQEICYDEQDDLPSCRRFLIYHIMHQRLLDTVSGLKDTENCNYTVLSRDLEETAKILIECLYLKQSKVSLVSSSVALTRLADIVTVTALSNCFYGDTQNLLGLLKLAHSLHIRSVHKTYNIQ